MPSVATHLAAIGGPLFTLDHVMAVASTLWFVIIAAVCCLMWLAGVRLGRGPTWLGRCTLLIGIVLMLSWGWLMRHPATAVQVIPVSLLSRIEGVGGVPLFMLVLGVAWARSQLTRQKHVVAWAMMFGAVYFVNGGLWLLQETPAAVMGQTVSPGGEVLQSQDYSCVAAASATTLNLLGVPSTEAQMAELTLTRPGTGATIIRALDGLARRLEHEPLQPVLLEPDWDELTRLPLPALTPLQFESTRRHMVTLTRISPTHVWIMDPVDGYGCKERDEFLAIYRGQAIAFESTSTGR